MSLMLLLFAVGVVLLAFEVFVPGAVLGVLGGVALVAGCVTAFGVYGAGGGLAATLVAALLAGGTVYVELKLLPKSRLGRRMLVHTKNQATSQSPLAQAGEVVGKVCVAVTPLVPSGYVELAGRRYEAWCRSGHAEAGTALEVVGLDNFRLIVTKTQSS